jgi:hypothetical protein
VPSGRELMRRRSVGSEKLTVRSTCDHAARNRANIAINSRNFSRELQIVASDVMARVTL